MGDIYSGKDCSITLVSRGTQSWTDGTEIKIEWKFYWLGTRMGYYRASPVVVSVRPPTLLNTAGVVLQIIERREYSGAIANQQEVISTLGNGAFVGIFDWNSTVNIREQEMTVRLITNRRNDSDITEMFLRDPISHRFNFLFSFSRAMSG